MMVSTTLSVPQVRQTSSSVRNCAAASYRDIESCRCSHIAGVKQAASPGKSLVALDVDDLEREAGRALTFPGCDAREPASVSMRGALLSVERSAIG